MGLGVLLHRCALGAALITCPHTLLTVRCLHAWQDRSRDCVQATPRSWALCCRAARYAHKHVRLVRVQSNGEERDRRDRARCGVCMRTECTALYVAVLACSVELCDDLSLSGMAKYIFLRMVYVTEHVRVVQISRTHP